MHRPLFDRAQHFLMVPLWCVASLAWAGDLSKLSDFATGDIVHNSAWISQIGDLNFASVDQGPAAAGTIDRQYADITQVGNGNQATVLQSGDLNRVRISQDGGAFGLTAKDGIALVTQEGTRNAVDLLQMGEGNRFSAHQSGNNNSINVNDSTSDALAMQRGTNNQIDLYQYNDGNKFSALQDGDYNIIKFTQNGGNEARVSETGNNNSVTYIQQQGGLRVDLSLHGGASVTVN